MMKATEDINYFKKNPHLISSSVEPKFILVSLKNLVTVLTTNLSVQSGTLR